MADHDGSRIRMTLTVCLMTVLTVTGLAACGTAEGPEARTASAPPLGVIRAIADGEPFALDGATLRGEVRVFVDAPEGRLERVAYFLDDAATPLAGTERAPFPLVADADGRALPWDTAALTDGRHRLVAELVPVAGRPQRVAAAFEVRNAAAPADDATAPSDAPRGDAPAPGAPTEPPADGPGADEPQPTDPPARDEPAPADPPATDPAPSGEIWRPRPGTSWQWQLTGAIDTSVDAEVFDVDLFDVPQRTIDELHAMGRRVICYFSAGSYEPWRSDADAIPAAARGKKMDGWDELWLDVSRLDLLAPVMTARLDLAAAKGCDAVEPDNVDGYANDTGFDLSYADQLAYNRFLAREAHARGLAIGLKNDLEQVRDLVDDFDFAVNEECFQWRECGMLTPFVEAGKAVFGAEYGVPTREFCPVTNALDLDFIRKELDLGAYREACR